MRGLFVTGTGTGVGKTIVSAALLAAIKDAGVPVRAHKPVLTGLAEPAGEWPADLELLAAAAGMKPDEVAPLRFGPALSPHLAATLAGETIEPDLLIERAHEAGKASGSGGERSIESPMLIVEGVGGLLVPLTDHFTVCDLAVELALPLLIAASPDLGTINHALLTLRVARSVGLKVCAVVLTPWPQAPSAMESSNRQTIERLGRVEVETLACVDGPNREELARAGTELPWRRWLGSTAP